MSEDDDGLMTELAKVPKGTRYIDAPNFPTIHRLLKARTPFIAYTPEQNSRVVGYEVDTNRPLTAEEIRRAEVLLHRGLQKMRDEIESSGPGYSAGLVFRSRLWQPREFPDRRAAPG